eukprot:s53_g12.t1
MCLAASGQLNFRASWYLAIQLHQAGALQEAIDLFASIASRSSELRIYAWLKQAFALQDAGSSGHAELLARQAIRALAAPDAQMQHGYGAMGAATAQFLGELLLRQHGESVWDAHLRQQALPNEDRSLLLEAEQLFRQALSLKLTRRAKLGLVQALLQLALFDDFGARMSEVESLLREDLSKTQALDMDIFASRCNLAFCFQLQGRDQEAKTIYDQVLPAYCRWADNQDSKVSGATPLSLGASTIGAACAAHNSACLDGSLSKLRWALQATRPDRRVSTCIATRLLQHLTIAGAEEEAQQLMEEFQLKKEEVSSSEDSFLALWPQRPSSRSKWQRSTTSPRRGVCCCGNARYVPSKCIAVGH